MTSIHTDTLYRKTIPFNIKATSEDDDKGLGKINGYGSIFGNKDSYGEVVVKGAFAKSLNESRQGAIKMLWQHQSDQPIGVWKDLKEDHVGLIGDAELPINIPFVREKYQMAKAGLVDGLSIGYMVRKNGYEILEDGTILLKDLDLREISLVTFPANPLSLVSDVKGDKYGFTPDKLESFLIELGFSKTQAKNAAVGAFNDDLSMFEKDKKEKEAIINSIKQLTETIQRGLFI
jgi:HK97 family phage prohead protease